MKSVDDRRPPGAVSGPAGRRVTPFAVLIALAMLTSSLAGACGDGSTDTMAEATRPLPDDERGVPENLEARAAGFRLFYRERLERILTAYNRFAMAGDVVPATTFGLVAVAREGNRFEVVPGPNDNNPIGHGAFVAYQAYKAFGGRPLELTLIRLFEGLAFLEAVSGHPGLTCREALPGWTRTVDGFAGTVSRIRDGLPVEPPAFYPSALEQEIVATFYGGAFFTYREDPYEYYYHLKPVQQLEQYAITWVFSEPPRFLRISDCCSSWMATGKGSWKGAYWGNHNSRDNFPDLAIGYLAAMECANDGTAPPDLREAASRAIEAGRRVGDAVVRHGGVLMTVGEAGGYDDLIPAGMVRPDGMTEWQDLGSISSCQMDYLAQALSTDGLSLPAPEIPLPGALEKVWLEAFLRGLGLDIRLPEASCADIDQAYLGRSWEELLETEILGMPWYEFAEILSRLDPGLIPSLLGSMMDDFDELELAVVALGYYARIAGKPDLLDSARRTLLHLVSLQRILAGLVYGDGGSGWGPAAQGDPSVRYDADEMRYIAAVRARMFGLEAPPEDFKGFARGERHNQWIESQLQRPETGPWPLLGDEEIRQRIEKELLRREAWIQERYRRRFADGPPVRRTTQGYEAIGPDDTWVAVENPRHEWFGGYSFLYEIPLCVWDPWSLDCSWAAMGCGRADLDEDGKVDASDVAHFEETWERFGLPSPWPHGAPDCSPSNDWCGRADLTRGGRLNEEDRAFMEAAQGCTCR